MTEVTPAPLNPQYAISHLYVSTACQHRRHDHCRSVTTADGQPKIPASCKFCLSACLCPCHREEPDA